jgi:hypothetical protein
MKNKNKLWLIALIILVFAACGNGNGDYDNGDNGKEDNNTDTTITLTAPVITINRTNSTNTDFIYSVNAVSNATGYETRLTHLMGPTPTASGDPIGTWGGTGNRTATVKGLTLKTTAPEPLASRAVRTGGNPSADAILPAMLKQPEINSYNDWFRFLGETSNILGYIGVFPPFSSDISFLFDEINIGLFKYGVDPSNLEDAKYLHGVANDATALILEIEIWNGIMETINDFLPVTQLYLDVINETMPRIWFNAGANNNGLNLNSSVRNQLDQIMRQWFRDQGYNGIPATGTWVQ